MSIFGRAQNSFIAVFLKFFFRLEVIGRENEPPDDAYIICANHISNMDPIILGVVSSKPIRYMAKAVLFKIPLLNLLVKAFGAYPVVRNKADVRSVKKTIELLNQKNVIGMFPTAHRRKGIPPAQTAFKSGAAMIAIRAKVGILPMTIVTKNNKYAPFRKNRVVIGKFIPYSETVRDSGVLTGIVFNSIKDDYEKYK